MTRVGRARHTRIVGATSFADHLAGLDDDALVALLRLRPDACVEPVPSDMGRLADRLCSPASVASALPCLDHDSLAVGRAIALLGREAGVPAVADLLGGSTALVERAVGDIDTRGLPKAELVSALSVAWSDRRALADRIAQLPASAREHLLDRLVYDDVEEPLTVLSMDDRRLAEAGLLLRSRYAMLLPREVVVGAWLASAQLSGPPTFRRRRTKSGPAPPPRPPRTRPCGWRPRWSTRPRRP